MQAYVKDCWDDPRPSYTLKTMLVGPTMAGKSSLLNALRKESRRLTRPDERTIGLDIKEITLTDPRAKGKVCFVVYDAGGHDEYQEMHQTFLSQATLYILVWNVAMPPPATDGNDQALEAMESKVADCATLIQTCAPGAKVILVASHADEIADAAEVERRCQRMVEATSRRLEQTYQAQRVELAELQRQAAPEHVGRMRQLRRVVDQPLRVPDHAVVVSAAQLDGVPELCEQMLDAAFDTTAFPEFGKALPNTYVSILRQARKRFESSSSVTCEEMQQALSQLPATGAEQCRCVVRSLGFEVSSARVPQVIYLQQVVGAAKVAAWADMRRVLAEHTLSDELINSVPTGRRWGLLHQLAYHGAAGEYHFLLEQGISFDGRLPTKDDDPKTPAQVATERGHDDFAATLAALLEWAPSPGMVGRLTLFTGPKSDPRPCRVELSSTGQFEVHLENSRDWSDFVASNPPEGRPGHVVGVEVGKAGVAAEALMKAHRGTGELLYCGIKTPHPPVSADDVRHDREAAKPVVWWSFSSTTTSLEVAKSFAGTAERVIYVISSSRARDVKVCLTSAFSLATHLLIRI